MLLLYCCVVDFFCTLSVARYPIIIDCKHIGEWFHGVPCMHVVGLDERYTLLYIPVAMWLPRYTRYYIREDSCPYVYYYTVPKAGANILEG